MPTGVTQKARIDACICTGLYYRTVILSLRNLPVHSKL